MRRFLFLMLALAMGMMAVAQQGVPVDRSSLDYPPEGYVNGLFTVNESGTQVFFSQGNLQYVDGEWRFAEHQWEYLGDNGQGSASEEVARDLFGWGTSGRSHGAVCFQPWSTDKTDVNYYAYGEVGNHLFDGTGEADWGSNGIANGGGVEGLWRVPTVEEWTYVFFTRATTSGIRFAKAMVNGVCGMVLLPDDWSESYHALSHANDEGGKYRANKITQTEWETDFEAYGAVFLPAAGYRFGTKLYYCGDRGSYYSATSCGVFHAWNRYFDDTHLGTVASVTARSNGMSVRLVATSTALWFTSVTTGEVTDITSDGATASGTVVTEGGTILTAVGVCWSTSPDPTVEGDHTDEGVLTGGFSSSLTGLQRNTTYYVRAYATDGEGDTMYGEVVEFTTEAELPAVTTSQVTDIAITTATAGGEVTDDGGTEVTECGVCWGTDPNTELTIDGDHVAASTPGMGTFTVALTGLTQNTTYYVCAYVTNSVGTVYGETVSFTTLRQPWTITATVEPTGGGTVTGANTYYQGDQCTLTATPATGYTFTKWTKDGTDYSTEATISFTVTAAADFVAVFTLNTYVVSATVNPTDCGSVTGANTYDHGAQCTLTATPADGYAFVNWTENGSVVSTDASYVFEVTAAHSLVANFKLAGIVSYSAFSVRDGYQVLFSQGNLQYIGSADTPYWQFADNQWDFLGDNGQGSASEAVSRDLFGWGTSSWDNGNTHYQPWSTGYVDNSSQGWGYGPTDGTSYEYDLTGAYAEADWGVHNAISNGGNTAGTWRTLTQPEWDYLFNTRSTTSGIRYAKANVNGINGVILLPDDWSADYYNLGSTNSYNASYSANQIDSTKWATLEQHGAVFLPAAGHRYGTSVYVVGSKGYYWSASYSSSYYARRVYFDDSHLNTGDWCERDFGILVRLVRPAQDYSFVIEANPNSEEYGTVSGGGEYAEGSQCTLTATANEGYVFVNWTEAIGDNNPKVVSTSATYTFRVQDNRTLVANFEPTGPQGALKGAFSVREGYQVLFSQGNLQYIGSAGNGDENNAGAYWQFAENQWDYLGNNGQGSDSKTVDRDLFAWGTSGWDNGNTYYQPWSTDYTSDVDQGEGYGPTDGTSYDNDLRGAYAEADWGIHNAIFNGGNAAGIWRTLTYPEWDYLFNTRTTESGIRYAKAIVNGIKGMILLPDDWSSSYYTLSNTNQGGASFGSNVITAAQWNTLEQHGAVFLPAAGDRSGTSVYDVGSGGLYWSASYSNSYLAWDVVFFDLNLDIGYSSRRGGRSVRLVRSSQDYTFTITASANPTEYGTVSGGGEFAEGSQCTLTATANEGYAFVNWTEAIGDNNPKVVSTSATYTFRVQDNRTLVANFKVDVPEGAINGKFSVRDGYQVLFSQGNLQYIGSAGNGDENNAGAYWKFAENQWDILGNNGQGSDSKTVDRDLFGWGTSGYSHGATCYQPWSTSTNSSDYYAYGSYTYNLNDFTGQADWGYNAIRNGGETENSGWRTLTQPEWDYLFNTRTTASGIRYAKACVNNINGVILLPDDWSTSYYSLYSTNTNNANFSSNIISADNWATLEQHGAVFLPAADYRDGTSVTSVGSIGNYWSASYIDGYYAWHVYFGSGLSTNNGYGRSFGHSVRLVRSSQDYTFTITASANPTECGTVSEGGTFNEGETCTLTATPAEGYTFVNWTEATTDGTPKVVSTSATFTFRVQGNRTLVANFKVDVPEGAIDGKFSVNADGGKVYFSQGNLQYIGSATPAYWRFAENQWDYLGKNGQGSGNQTVDRDLFGWGTSGYNHGATCYQPWSTSTTNRDYYAYGNESYNLNDQTGRADWGYNPISNGGGTENSDWRTLTGTEWDYLLFTRTTTSGIRYAKARVNNINGVILLPDDWSTSYYALNSTNTNTANFSSNTISADNWAALEQHGAVFLPAAGYRAWITVYATENDAGRYWTASKAGISTAQRVFFNDSELNSSVQTVYFGYSVRLVCSAKDCTFTIEASASSTQSGTVSGGGNYTEGSQCTLTATANEGYVFVNWKEGDRVVSTSAEYIFRVYNNRTLVANFKVDAPEGAINGKFTVNANGGKVYFSQGNLQYIGSAGNGDENNTGAYWKFAEHQWDYLGDNGQGSDSKTVDRDLFGWGTSGWYNGNTYYQPWCTSYVNNSQQGYGYGPTNGTSCEYNLTGAFANADWGVHNAISIGGNTESSGWRTLTHEEWAYLFNTRGGEGQIRYAKACVNNVNGVILLPDDWSTNYYLLENPNGGSYSDNTITADNWTTLEQHGAVFLPAAGYRYGTSVSDVGSLGRYWSASYSDSYLAWYVGFYDDYLDTDYRSYRYYGLSVRLVRSAQ